MAVITPGTQRGLAIGVLALGALGVGVGVLLSQLGADAVCDPEAWTSRPLRRRCLLYLYPTARLGGLQLGALATLLGAAWLWLLGQAGPRRASILAAARRVGLPLAASLAIGFATGEIALRLLYRDGISFGTHDGPFVRRFERDFVYNRYEGPSRGPQLEDAAEGGARILVQGDSITWGQGVKPESHLYTFRLLEALRARDPGVQMAVLAYGGREITGHLEHIRERGEEVAPDLIVYQWFVNDIEIDKSGRPQVEPPWRKLFFHNLVGSLSYLWFFLDFSLPNLVASADGYVEYIETDFAEGTANWRSFEETFAEWAAEATGLTPRVVVVLYPRLRAPDEIQFGALHERVAALARRHGLEALDLRESFAGERGRFQELWASPFDPHPGARAHALVAEALEAHILATWPELFAGSGP